jgi:hypothetical protein
MKVGCLGQVLLFLAILPFVLALPPLGFALFCFVAYTVYFYRKG